MTRRTDRLNSLLKEVISEVIRSKVRHPGVDEMCTVSRVSITPDLHYAKVYISVIGDDKKKKETVDALNAAHGFIAVNASKEVTMRYFPELTFILDDSVDKHARIEDLIKSIQDERIKREEMHGEHESGTL